MTEKERQDFRQMYSDAAKIRNEGERARAKSTLSLRVGAAMIADAETPDQVEHEARQLIQTAAIIAVLHLRRVGVQPAEAEARLERAAFGGIAGAAAGAGDSPA